MVKRMALLVAGLVSFLGIHLVPAFPTLRAALVSRLGDGRYKGVFSLLSAVGFLLIVVGFARASTTERVFAPVPLAIAAAPFVMTLAIILLAAANMRGYIRLGLRHPMLIGLMLWATVHLLANGDLRGTVLFGAFLAYAIVDFASAMMRNAVKSFTPSAKFDVLALLGGVAVAVAIMFVHRLLFGVRVVAFGL
jgi:uncharacterized membrane protein